MRLADDIVRVFKDLSGWKFAGKGPCKSTDFKIILVTSPLGLQEIPNQLQGLLSEELHDFRTSVEEFKLAFHVKRAWP